MRTPRRRLLARQELSQRPERIDLPRIQSGGGGGRIRRLQGSDADRRLLDAFPRHPGQRQRYRRIASQRRQLQLPAAVETSHRQRMGRKGLQQHLQDRGPRQPRARRHRQDARSDERTGVQHVQGRTAAHARLRLRMGLPALRRHSLHRSRAGAGRQLYPHAARRSHRQDSQRGSQRRDARLPAAAAQQGDLRLDPSGPRGRLRTQSPHLPELGILRRGRQMPTRRSRWPRMPATPSNPTIRASAAKTTPRANPVRRTSSA